MRAIVYVRVSSEEQKASGLGLEAQEAACVAYVKRQGWEVSTVVRDAAVSGSTPIAHRPALAAAVATMKRGDALVVAKRDRIARDLIETATLERELARRGVRVVSAAGEGTEGTTPTDLLMRQVVDAFAQHEREVIRARTRAALAAKKARGEKTGGDAPYGWRVAADGRTLIADESEGLVVQQIAKLRGEGWSLRRIADAATVQGWPMRRGTKWTHTQIDRILRAQRPVKVTA